MAFGKRGEDPPWDLPPQKRQAAEQAMKAPGLLDSPRGRGAGPGAAGAEEASGDL